jgi:hypothetical protein
VAFCFFAAAAAAATDALLSEFLVLSVSALLDGLR